MIRNKTWIISVAIVQLLTGCIHGLSLFGKFQGQNDTERQLIELMYGYKFNMGAGIERSMADLFVASNSCFTLLYLFGGSLNLYLLRNPILIQTWRGLLIIQILFFGTCFAVNFFLTFLPPAVLTAAVFLLLIIALLLLRPAED